MNPPISVAVCGGGPGGFAAAIALRSFGIDVTVYEQAPSLARVGADINLTPNVVRALDGLGVGPALRATAATPACRISREWDTGNETSRLPMGSTAEERYGAPQLTIHRGDLIAALDAELPSDVVRLNTQVARCEQGVITFASGETVEHDVVVAADGVHSVVRRCTFGADAPIYTGIVSWRCVVPTTRLDVENLDSFTKWWGPTHDQQVVVFPLLRGEETFIFATNRDDDWSNESWTTPGDANELRALHEGWHADVQALLAAVDAPMKSALHVREPMPSWVDGKVALLGDAAHPMMPFMAQGAGMAIEDAVVLARALDAFDSVPAALAAYESARRPRASEVQKQSSANEWMRHQGNADWLYGYDAWNVDLD